MEHTQIPANPYSDKFLRELCKDARIPHERETEVRKFLESARYRWHENDQNEELYERVKDSRNLLRQLCINAHKLQGNIEKLSQDTWEALSGNFSPFLQSPYDPVILYDDWVGHYLSVDSGEPNKPRITIQIDELSKVLDSLSVIADVSQFYAPERKQGPAPDFKLKQWVGSAASFWNNKLQLEFTLAATQSGEPLSNAAVFCETAYLVLAPKTPRSRIRGEMKKAIAWYRRYDGKKK